MGAPLKPRFPNPREKQTDITLLPYIDRYLLGTTISTVVVMILKQVLAEQKTSVMIVENVLLNIQLSFPFWMIIVTCAITSLLKWISLWSEINW